MRAFGNVVSEFELGRFVKDVVGTGPHFAAHFWIGEGREVGSFLENVSRAFSDRERCAGAADEIYENGFFKLGVVEPEFAGARIPGTEIKIGVGVVEGIEYDVMDGPVLGWFNAEGIFLET